MRSLELDEGSAVLQQLDGLALAPATYVLRHQLLAVEHADDLIVGDERQGPLGELGRDGVVVPVESEEGGFAHVDGQDHVGHRQRDGQGQEALAFLREAVGDGALRPDRMRSGVGDLINEAEQFSVALLDARDGACRQARQRSRARSRAEVRQGSSAGAFTRRGAGDRHTVNGYLQSIQLLVII